MFGLRSVNGITDVATNPDLLDRAIILVLPAIPEEERGPEAELWGEFEEALPEILGGIFTAVSGALRELPSVELASLPRMADFAKWATAAESALGMEAGEFSWKPIPAAARRSARWRWKRILWPWRS
jgi:putative DNA primase/helicase